MGWVELGRTFVGLGLGRVGPFSTRVDPLEGLLAMKDILAYAATTIQLTFHGPSLAMLNLPELSLPGNVLICGGEISC